MQPAVILKGKSPFVPSRCSRPETQTHTCFPRHRGIPTQLFEELFRRPRRMTACFSTDLQTGQTLEHVLLHLRDLRASEGQGCSVIFTGVYKLIFKFAFFLHCGKRSTLSLPEVSGICWHAGKLLPFESRSLRYHVLMCCLLGDNLGNWAPTKSVYCSTENFKLLRTLLYKTT